MPSESERSEREGDEPYRVHLSVSWERDGPYAVPKIVDHLRPSRTDPPDSETESREREAEHG